MQFAIWTSYVASLRGRHRETMLATKGPGPVDTRINLVIAAVCALATLILVAVGGHRIGFDSVYGVGQHLPARVLEMLTYCGDTLLAVCLMAIFAKREPRVLWMAVLAIIYAALLSHGLKALVGAARPPAVLGDWLTVLGPVWTGHSFPSGHTVTAFTAAACLSVGLPGSARLLIYALAVGAGVSRVWVGVHWPVDVITGAGIAGVAVVLAIHTAKISDWGFNLIPHLSVVALVAVCGVLELFRVPEYPLAQPLSLVVAALSLSMLARDYLYRPLMTEHAVGTAT